MILKTLSLTNIFPATENQIKAILTSMGAVEVYRMPGEIVYRKVNN